MNDETNSPVPSESTDQPVNDSQPAVATPPVPKTKSKKKLLVYGGMGLAVIAVSVLVYSVVYGNAFSALAETPAKLNLVTGFRNLAKNRPTLVTGNVGFYYSDLPSSASAGLVFKTTMDPKTGNSAGNAWFSIDKSIYPYEYATINKDHYFKIGNLGGLKSSLKPSNAVYKYLEPSFGTLSKSSDQWLVQKNTTKSSKNPGQLPPGSDYDCVVTAYPYLSAGDAQSLQAAFIKNTPIKIQKTSKTTLNGEKVTKTDVVVSRKKDVDAFIARINSLSAVQKINSCAQKIANTPALPKATDAFKNNNVKVSVYYNSNKIIKKITLSTSGGKSTVSFEANFDYSKQAPITTPANAKPADNFLNALFKRQR